MTESILIYLPPSGERKNYRLQTSLSLAEATDLEKLLINPMLPFDGDMSTLIRTFVRAGIIKLHEELKESEDSFIQSMRPILGSELLKWSSAACDSFATAGVDHLQLAIKSGDPQLAQDVVLQITGVMEEIRNASARAMLKQALHRRGFLQTLESLRALLIDHDKSVYWIDTLQAEVFT